MNNPRQTCIIFGGEGYIGSMWCKRLLASEQFNQIVLVDIKKYESVKSSQVIHITADVSQELPISLQEFRPAWIFNFAAVHREPGHDFKEYFDTNIPGAENVCQYARLVNCKNILFTASIAVYYPTDQPTSENSPKYPPTGYGISKLLAENVHEIWQAEEPTRRLIICRPGVIYGPGDPGNILRMIKAVKRGVFFFPGNPNIFKSYGYIEGLLDSFEFTMARGEPMIHYNYVETPTEPLNKLVEHVQTITHKKSRTISLPLFILVPIARFIQWLTRGKSPIHPKRVEKAATPTHIIPQVLIDLGFTFRYDFKKSLLDWRKKAPEDF